MRTIIAGSRDCIDYNMLSKALKECSWAPSIVISGTARGADQLGIAYSIRNKIPLEQYPAKWWKHGKKAGFIRNKEMVEKAEALIALWDFESKGTKNMIKIAEVAGLKLFVFDVRG